jgi:phage FluMu protein Com
MQEKVEWIICPVCGKKLLKYKGGAGDAKYEVKCSGKNCGSLIIIYSAGQTLNQKEKSDNERERMMINRDNKKDSDMDTKNSEKYFDPTSFSAITGKHIINKSF